MPRDYKISHITFFENNGFSAKYFVEHMRYFINNYAQYSHINFDIYRYKMVLKNKNTNTEITLRPHYNGHSRKYVTLLRNNSILATLRFDLAPCILTQIVLNYLEMH